MSEQTVVEEVKTEAKDAETDTAKLVEEVKEKAVVEAKKTRVDISNEEKLALRDEEAAFLRVHVEIKDLQSRITNLSSKAEASSKKYMEKLEELTKKYGISKVEMVFDNISNAFVALGKKL